MHVVFGFVFIIIFISLGFSQAKEPLSASSKLIKQIGDEYYEWLKKDNIELRMKLGLKIEQLPDMTEAFMKKRAARANAILERLKQVRLEEINHDEFLSLDVLQCRLRDIIEEHRFFWFFFPHPWYLNGVNNVFKAFVFKNDEDTRHFLILMNQYPVFIEQIHLNFKEQFARGFILPRKYLDLLLPYLNRLIGNIDESPFGVKPARLESLSKKSAQAFRDQLSKIIEKKVNPALKSLVNYLEGEYRKKAPEAVGLSQYPGGKEYYASLVKYYTSLDLTPEEVHQIGLKEVERLNALIDKFQISMGFNGTRVEFKEMLKKDPRFYARTQEEAVERLLAPIRRIEPKIDSYFIRKPKAPCTVKRLVPELEGTMTFGFFQEPSDADNTGYYFYNGSDLSKQSLLNAADLIYHELIPGHHFQISIAFENKDIPDFRRTANDTAYLEGWAEYAASLAGEMGMYSDPYDYYGRIYFGDLFMSVRLVVDTGINELGWSLEKAEAFLRENTILSDEQVHSEALRYSVGMPGQALAYRIGFLKFYELREKARLALENKFDIRCFNDAVLINGSLPLSTLEKHVDWFIKSEKTSKSASE